jgi:hypothetical protein
MRIRALLQRGQVGPVLAGTQPGPQVPRVMNKGATMPKKRMMLVLLCLISGTLLAQEPNAS